MRSLEKSPWLAGVWQYLRNLIFDSPGLKLIAVLITVVLWLSVSSQPVTETTLREPISFLNTPKGLSVVDQDIDTVRLTVRGPRDMLTRLRSGEIHLDPVVDLKAYENQPGKRIITITNENISVPQNVEILDIKPTRFAITLSSIAEKEVPIQPLFEGQLPRGLVMAGYRVEPATVQVRGPKNHVEQITVARTESILLHGRETNFQAQAAVDVQDPEVEVSQGMVKVSIDLAPALRPIIFDNLTVRLDPADRKTVTDPPAVRVTLEGVEEVVRQLTRSVVSVTADPRAAGPDGAVAVRVILPPDLADKVRVKQIEPERVIIKRR